MSYHTLHCNLVVPILRIAQNRMHAGAEMQVQPFLNGAKQF